MCKYGFPGNIMIEPKYCVYKMIFFREKVQRFLSMIIEMTNIQIIITNKERQLHGKAGNSRSR